MRARVGRLRGWTLIAALGALVLLVGCDSVLVPVSPVPTNLFGQPGASVPIGSPARSEAPSASPSLQSSEPSPSTSPSTGASPSASPVASPTATPSPRPTLPPTPSPVTSNWQRSTQALPFADDTRLAFSSTAGFLLAAGSGNGFQLESSTDGLTWIPEAVVGSDGGMVNGMASNSTSDVALGSHGKTGAVWLLQSQGDVWTPVAENAFPPTKFRGSDARTLVSDVIWTGKAFVAVGQDYQCQGSCPEAKGVVAVWTSADGSTWKRVNLGKAEVRDQFPGLVSAGTTVLAYGSIDGTTLRSDDGGQSWAARGGDLITPIVASGQGFLGLRDQDVVTSNDGRSWRTVASLDVPTLDHWTGMVAVDGGFVLVGVGFEGAGSVPQALVYVSRDGRTWKGLPDDPTLQGIQLVDVTTDGNSVVVFGHEGALVPGSWRGTFAASAASLFEAASHVPAATPTPLASASPAASPSAATSPNTTPSRAP